MKDHTFVGTKIPKAQHKALAKVAAENQRSIGAEIRIAIIMHVAKKGGGDAKQS